MSLEKVDNKIEIHCTQCGRLALKGTVAKYNCETCGMIADRRNVTQKKRIKCMNPGCPGVLEIVEEKPYSYCELCKDSENQKIPLDSIRNPECFEEKRGENISEHAKFDLVLVAPRHLFRMPYSLHEKTSLASVVLRKEQIDDFVPRDANPLNMKITDFYPNNQENEAARLLKAAIEWKRQKEKEQEEVDKNFYGNYKSVETGDREYEEIDSKDVRDEMFPDSIKNILKGLKDGRKRGLFVLITFFRSLNYSPEEINNRIREWNKINPVPLKEGYVKSQIDWHIKQKRKILPPNYENDAFYKDLGVLEKKPDVKNPLVELKRNMKKRR
jgi:ribosomal protein L37E